MKIKNFIFIYFSFINYILGFSDKSLNQNNINKKLFNKNKLIIDKKNNNFFKIINNKIKSYYKITRSNNVLETLLLNFSGGYIVSKNINNLFISKKFTISSIITVFIMQLSMILNDLFDMEVDKINNSDRPLIKGDVTKREAIIYSIGLSLIIEILNILYLPLKLQYIIHFVLAIVFLYTPILKKILFIKNITCASLVSFSIYFSGLSMNINIDVDNNKHLLYLLSLFVFLGSLYNELLLDMRDKDGDKLKNINTIPVIFDNKISFLLSTIILKINIITNALYILFIYNYKILIPLLYIYYKLFVNHINIFISNYNIQNIKYTVYKSTEPFVSVLTYIIFLSQMENIIKIF